MNLKQLLTNIVWSHSGKRKEESLPRTNLLLTTISRYVAARSLASSSFVVCSSDVSVVPESAIMACLPFPDFRSSIFHPHSIHRVNNTHTSVFTGVLNPFIVHQSNAHLLLVCCFLLFCCCFCVRLLLTISRSDFLSPN